MSETATEVVETEETAGETSANEPEETTEVEGAEHLGDPGKKALAAMKAREKSAREEARLAKAEAAELRAKAEGKEAEHQAQQETQRVKDEALAAANTRILKAEVRAAAAGKLADPADALQFIDLSSFDVNDDGEVDATDIASAVDDLIKKKPYLAAQGGSRFQGSADGGARNDTPPATLPEQIAAAEKAGDWALARSLKSRQLVELNTQ